MCYLFLDFFLTVKANPAMKLYHFFEDLDLGRSRLYSEQTLSGWSVLE